MFNISERNAVKPLVFNICERTRSKTNSLFNIVERKHNKTNCLFNIFERKHTKTTDVFNMFERTRNKTLGFKTSVSEKMYATLNIIS